MATRVDKQQAPAAAKAAADASASDLDVLHPERSIAIGGRSIVVREYGFIEGLRITPLAKPFQDALYAVAGITNAAPGYDAIEAVIAEHADAVTQLVAQSAGVEVEWVEGLSDKDGDLLFLTWWMANAGFFIRRVLRRAAQEQRRKSPSPGQGSTPPSSAPDTAEPPTTSASSLAGS